MVENFKVTNCNLYRNMSHLASGEARITEVIDAPKGHVSRTCRIPQRLPPPRMRVVATRTKAANNVETTKTRFDTIAAQHNTRFIARTFARPRSTESRQKSQTHGDDASPLTRQLHPPANEQRPIRPIERERLLPAPKRPSTIPKRVAESFITASKGNRPVITVPLSQRPNVRMGHKKNEGLPDQETIKQCEELEIQREISDLTDILNDLNDGESLTSPSDKVTSLKLNWQEKMMIFEKMKVELNGRQRAIMELYSKMRCAQQKMMSMGHTISLPSAEELRIMNVTKMSPNQLLKMCAVANSDEDGNQRDTKFSLNSNLTIDMNKLYNMPNKIVATCEQTLAKRQEIINWFETLKTEERGISMSKLSKKIGEFNAENEMLSSALQKTKSEFLKELSEIIDYLRKGVSETMALQLRTEELTYELSELNSKNADLRKQIHTSDQFRSVNTRHKIEELEKELKEERCKKMLIRDRLTRAEGQIKIGLERASQLEAALEQARSHTFTLEQTVQQLNEQNRKLQSDFDKELNKLTESIRENTEHLEEIAQAREKLQMEKEDLEKRLHELSAHYNESLHNMKAEMNNNVTKVIETEKKFDEEKEERKKLEGKLQCMCTQLVESELRYKDILKQLQDSDSQLKTEKIMNWTINSKAMKDLNEMEATKRELNVAHIEIDEYKKRLVKQTDTIREIERDFKETINLENKLKHDLNIKEEYAAELEKKQTLLEKQLQESEYKMGYYEEQLTALKNHIAKLKQDFGEFENINELHELINQQRAKLLETTRENGELAEALQNKDIELERHVETITEHGQLLEQRDGVVKMLSEKEEEHANIIKLLRNNLEMRAKADNEFSKQLSEKNAEIDSLVANVETRKQQISQLEKIILTLEDQLRKLNLQRRKDQDKMTLLEKTIAEYEAYHMETKRSIESPAENLDNLIKILEDELGSPLDIPQNNRKVYDYSKKRDKQEKIDNRQGSDYRPPYHKEKKPTKIVMGNFVKKTTYIATNDEQYKGDNLDRNKAITNIDTQKWVSDPEPINLYTGTATQPPTKDYQLQFLMSNHHRDEKKCKMFKLAGHRL